MPAVFPEAEAHISKGLIIVTSDRPVLLHSILKEASVYSKLVNVDRVPLNGSFLTTVDQLPTSADAG